MTASHAKWGFSIEGHAIMMAAHLVLMGQDLLEVPQESWKIIEYESIHTTDPTTLANGLAEFLGWGTETKV